LLARESGRFARRIARDQIVEGPARRFDTFQLDFRQTALEQRVGRFAPNAGDFEPTDANASIACP
jgi:hypothetical protein